MYIKHSPYLPKSHQLQTQVDYRSVHNMNQDQALRGGCSCGRNRFLITIPSNVSNTARVLFDDSTEQRKPYDSFLGHFTTSLLFAPLAIHPAPVPLP